METPWEESQIVSKIGGNRTIKKANPKELAFFKNQYLNN
jgi:hypothetical protein